MFEVIMFALVMGGLSLTAMAMAVAKALTNIGRHPVQSTKIGAFTVRDSVLSCWYNKQNNKKEGAK